MKSSDDYKYKGLVVMSYNNILLATFKSHCTHGVENTALGLCRDGSFLHHLLVLPKSWEKDIEEELLTDIAEKIRAGTPLEEKREQEIQKNILRVKNFVSVKNIHYSFELIRGEITECMFRIAESYRFDLAILGIPYPQDASKMALQISHQSLLRFSPVPLLVVPYPEEESLFLPVKISEEGS